MLTTFLTVTNTDDSGPGSLREAILSANSAADDVTIQFAIPASDPHFEDVDSALPRGDGDPDAFVISPLSPLPELSNPDYPITLDGQGQAIWSGSDLNPFGPEIVLNGSQAGWSDGLRISLSGNRVIGLNIQQFALQGVFCRMLDECLDAELHWNRRHGNGRPGKEDCGVLVGGGVENQIGGTTAEARNVISGNLDDGVHLSGFGVTRNVVQGNYIGTDASGALGLGNGWYGVFVDLAADNLIGGASRGEGT